MHFKVSKLMEVSQERFLSVLCSPTSEVSSETKGRNKDGLIQREFLVGPGSALSIQKIILHAVWILEIWQCEMNDKEFYPHGSYTLGSECILTL